MLISVNLISSTKEISQQPNLGADWPNACGEADMKNLKIDCFHIMSLPPCWRTITKDSSLVSIVSSTNMAATSLSSSIEFRSDDVIKMILLKLWDFFNCLEQPI